MGNEYFNAKDYRTALAYYNRSVQVGDDSNKHLALGNRAITKIRLKDYAGAIKDCDAALALQPEYIKCYVRKGMAYRLVRCSAHTHVRARTRTQMHNTHVCTITMHRDIFALIPT